MALLPGITAGLGSPPTCLVCGCVCGFCCSSFPFGNMRNTGYFPESETKMLTSSRTPPRHQLVELTHFYLALRAMPASVPLPLSPSLHLSIASALPPHTHKCRRHCQHPRVALTPVWHVPCRRQDPACCIPSPSYISRNLAGLSSPTKFLTWPLHILQLGSSQSSALSKLPTAACRPSPLPVTSTFGCFTPSVSLLHHPPSSPSSLAPPHLQAKR